MFSVQMEVGIDESNALPK